MSLLDQFLKPQPNSNLFEKLKDLLRAFILHYFITTICVIIIIITDIFIVKLLHYKSIRDLHYTSDEFLARNGLWKGMLLMTIIGPIIEEISFRLLLIPRRINVALSFSFLCFFLSGSIGYIDNFFCYFLRLLFSLVVFLLFFSCPKLNSEQRLFNNQNKRFILSSICFGLMHIFNFTPIQKEIFFLYPIYVLPQISLGFILGIVRIRNGFMWSVLLHILVNGSVTWYKLVI